MMYKKSKKLKASGGINITNYGLFIIQEMNNSKKIIQINTNGDECDRYDFIDMKDVFMLHFLKTYFIVSFKNGTTKFYVNQTEVYELEKQLYFLFVKEDDLYIYIENDGNIFRFNKKENNMESYFLSKDYLMLSYVFDGNLIFEQDGKILSSYKASLHSIDLSWQLDIRSLFPEQEDVEIRDIKEYQGSLIIATTAAVLRLSVEDGSIIWISEGYARTIEIVGNTGYVCTSGSLFKVNLDNGEESGYGWGEYHKLPNFTYNGKDYWATGHRVVYHDGLLWYSVYSSGDSFLIAINPENGNYEWIHYVDTIGKTDEPQFFGDYMFLYDTEHTLHIYQKES